ncbi:ATP-binding protein [Nocardia sp. CA-129566]|uniref:ATP-binding protein n=1 Tax=Nocardia sp. CA-129566 TaxID=3239976 RepID=UPI003D97CE0F
MDSLIGRRDETARLRAFLEQARQSRGGALLIHGEPGIGKSALLVDLADAAADFVIMRACGAEFETELPYSALHQLCAAALAHLDRLPPAQGRALRIAFGMDVGTPDPFLLGAATLGLLLEYDRPVLCLVDDAQWLDRASAHALAFVARRVDAERVAMVFAARDDSGDLNLLPQLAIPRLGDTAARTLLARALPGPLDDRVRDRILAEARGNPLALLELPGTTELAGLTGDFDLPAPAAAERSYRARLAVLPERVRLLLTVAAAEPVGDPCLLWQAAALLGIETTADDEVPLVEFGTRIRFVHPLARSAVYRAATDRERRRAHGALARVSDPVADPDRVAWHRAQASVGPDEEVAAALARSAARAQARGGVAAAAAFLERSAALTFDPALRAERVLAAVEAKLSAGEFEAADELLSTVPSDDPRIDLLRGRISFARYRGEDRPTVHLLRAAAKLAVHEPDRARACYVDAIETAVLTGGLDSVIAAAAATPRAPARPGSVDVVLDGMAALTTEGHAAAAKLLRPLVSNHRDEVWSRWPTLGYLLALELWDPDAIRAIASRIAVSGRSSGSLHMLRIGLAMLATVAVHAGDFGAAQELISEEEAIAEATSAAPLVYARIHLAALRGRRAEAEVLFAAVGPHLTLSVQYATAVLHNGLADYPTALRAAEQAVATGDLGLAGQALPELVEAAVRCGEAAVARSALAALTERAGEQSWGRGVEAWARAMVDEDEDAHREAVALLDTCPMRIWSGRAHLVYGEWLRRKGRRRDARTELRHAHELLSDFGAEAFATRAAGELRATGEHARRRTAQASDVLTMQEVHIARLAADGATSKEIAATLFLSPRTVEAHLRNIFRKLGITSRRQLRDIR